MEQKDIVEKSLLIIQNLVTNEKYFKKVFPFLQREYFEEENCENQIVDVIKEYYKKYEKLITFNLLRLFFNTNKKTMESELNVILNRIDSIEKIDFGDISFQYLIDITENFFRKRSLHNALFKSIDYHDNEEFSLILPEIEKASSLFFDLSVGIDFIEDAKNRYEYYHLNEMKYPTHLKVFNHVTGGGFSKKTITVILGQTGVGKSRMLVDLGIHYMKVGLNVLYVTFELSEMEIAKRCDANVLDIDIGELRNVEENEYHKRVNVLKRKNYGEFIIKEFPMRSANAIKIKTLIEEVKQKKGFDFDVIIVDYLSIAAPNVSVPESNSYIYHKTIAEDLKALAMETNTIFLTAAQLNRSGWNTSDVSMSHIAESAGILHVADFVPALAITDDLLERKQIILRVLKNRLFSLQIGAKNWIIGVDDSRMKHYDVEQTEPIKDISTEEIEKKFENFKF